MNFLVRVFIDCFGITRPNSEHEARATRFISYMLAGVILLVLLAAYTFMHV